MDETVRPRSRRRSRPGAAAACEKTDKRKVGVNLVAREKTGKPSDCWLNLSNLARQGVWFQNRQDKPDPGR